MKAAMSVCRPAMAFRALCLLRPDPLTSSDIIGEPASWYDHRSRDRNGTYRRHRGQRRSAELGNRVVNVHGYFFLVLLATLANRVPSFFNQY
jgi:hypothetical protein